MRSRVRANIGAIYGLEEADGVMTRTLRLFSEVLAYRAETAPEIEIPEIV